MSTALRSILDLLIILVLTTVSAVVVATDVSTTAIRILFGLLLVLFLPGYALVSAFFPEAPEAETSNRWHNAATFRRSIGTVERALLAVLFSMGVVPLVAFAINFTPYDIARIPVLVGVVWWVYTFTAVGIARRLLVPADRRFYVDFGRPVALIVGSFDQQPYSLRSSRAFEPRNETELLLNVLVVVGVLALAVSVAFAAVSAPSEDSFTEFYLLTENDDDELVAEGFRTTFDGGEPVPVIAAIGNHEGETMEYTGVIILQDPSNGDDQSGDELDRFRTTVSSDSTETVERDVTPSMAGDELQLTVLLYTDDPPEEPTVENAYRSVHLRITVEG